MNFEGIGLVDKPKIIKIVQAVQIAELANLYGALRGSDESLRNSFIRFLLLNPIPGDNLALTKLAETANPETAVRAAAICLLAKRIEGEALD